MNDHHILLTLPLLLLSVIFSEAVFAQEQSPIIFSNSAQKEVLVVDDEGNETIELVGVEIAVPGDVILYTSIFTNQGTESASDITVNNPVPFNTAYVGFSARGENTQVVFSIDGGMSFAAPAELIVIEEEGQQRTALPEEYTHIRWIYSGDLAPGQSSSVSFKVRIL